MSLFPIGGSNIKGRVSASFPVSVVGTGGIAVSKDSGVWTVEPAFDELTTIEPSLLTNPSAKQMWIYDPVTDEYNVMTLLGLGEALYVASSTTEFSIGTGSKAFTTQQGKGFAVGSFVIAVSDSGPSNFMLGQVTAYSGTTLTVNVTTIGGTGTHDDWTIRLSASAGSAGKSSGFSYLWDDGTSSADPGSGNIRANNATLSSATALYISETDADGAGIAAIIAAADDSDSTVRAQVKIYNPVTPTSFAIYNITGANTDNGSWDTLAVTYVTHGGSFTDGDALRVEFIAAGDKGELGAAGASSGVAWDFDNSTSMADPGTGDIRFNHGTLASVTAIALSALTAEPGNPDISDYVVTWDDSTSTVKGHVVIRKTAAPENFAIYSVTGSVTDNSTWLQISVTHVASNGSFTNTDELSLSFIRTGDKGLTGDTGATGSTGSTGATGPTGATSGIKQVYDNSTSDADPGNGEFRLNHATPASATEAYLDNLDGGGSTVSGIIDLWDDSSSTVKGHIRFEKSTDPTVWAEFRVTGSVVDGTGYRKLTLTSGAGSGAFSNGDTFAITFTRTGDQGSAGAGSGDMLAANNLSDLTNTATARSNLGLVIGTHVQAYDSDLAAIAALTPTDNNFIVGNGSAWVAESGSTARTSLGVAIGSDVQAYSANLGAIAGLSVTDGNIIVGNGSTWVAESGGTARASLGLAIGTDVQAYDADTAKTDVAQTFTVPQSADFGTITDNTSWDGTAKMAWDCAVNGGDFDVVNPSALRANTLYCFRFTFSSAHTVNFGTSFKGVGLDDYVPSAESGKVDLLWMQANAAADALYFVGFENDVSA